MHFIRRMGERVWWVTAFEMEDGQLPWAEGNQIVTFWNVVLSHERNILQGSNRESYQKWPLRDFFAPYEYQYVWYLNEVEMTPDELNLVRKDFSTFWMTHTI